jgi:phosphatidylserine decarboxylase
VSSDELLSLELRQRRRRSSDTRPQPFDSFVTVNVPPNRHSTKVVKRSLEPEFPAASSTFDFPLFRGQAGLLGAIECVAWDKVRRLVARATPLGPGALTNESPHGFLQDMLRKEYLGEAAVQVADWFPNSEPVEWSPDLEVCPRPYR